VFVGPAVVLTNDLHPRSVDVNGEIKSADSWAPVGVVVKEGASLGARAVCVAPVTVGRWAMVGAGAVVTRDVPPFAIVTGNPARIRGYAGADRMGLDGGRGEPGAPQPANAHGARLVDLHSVDDLRGRLSVGEVGAQLPFPPRRVFFVYDVPTVEVRGEHAHRTLEQVLICVHGSLAVVVDDGHGRAEFRLDSPSRGLYIPPRVWAIQYGYSRDAVLMVLASHCYESGEYIRDYDEFRQIVAGSA
jgi:hypothetical protein